MECSQVLLWISEYVDGTLTPSVCSELEKHLSICQRCRSIVNTLKMTLSLYHTVKFYDVPSVIHESLHRALRQEWETHKVKVSVRYAGFPPVELIEKKKQIELLIKLPGVDKETINLVATPKSVEITGFNKRVEGIYYQSEINYGKFSKLIKLPTKIDVSRVKAYLKDGILTVKLPKLA
ncbi:MAG: Hsp20 family protein [bacterium]|nr:Hsp20 family protein [bacterium]